jgi:glycosyltransferase involved in cell wall biosynthesis
LSRLGYYATPVLTRLAAATVCVSDGLRDYLLKGWRAAAGRTHRIYNPVVGGNLSPAASEAELLAREPVVLAAGRLISYKNFPALIRAFAAVKPATARLMILGEGPERPAIAAEIARLGLTDRVQLLGYRSEPWPYYAQARCFALPSQREPFGLVVVEALASGLPVVTTDCDGPREILAGGVGGIVAQGDENALAQAISRALAAPGDPRARLDRARLFSPELGVDAYEDLMEKILADRPRETALPALTNIASR